MTDDAPILSQTEIAIRDLFKNHPQRAQYQRMCNSLGFLAQGWDQSGIDPQLQAWALQTFTTAMLSAQKQSRVGHPQLPDLLADDLVDTVKGRSVPGVIAWLTPQ